MARKIVGLVFALIAIFSVGNLYAHSPAMHMYLGYKTYAMWYDYDKAFYDALVNPDNVITRKYYFIGLTLPDMLDQNTQDGIRKLVDNLTDADVNTNLFDFKGPLQVLPQTISATRDNIVFNGTPPNANCTALRAMMEYAKTNSWSTKEKALIYGTYMHVLQDQIAHMVQQPSTFGYGLTIEPPLVQPDSLLQIPEMYNELFTATHVTDWSFIKEVFCGTDYVTYNRVLSDFQFDCVTKTVPPGNPELIACWQDFEIIMQTRITALRAFQDAAVGTGYYNNDYDNKLYYKLKGFMTGWAFIMYVMNGYDITTDPPSLLGGIQGNPNLTPDQIKSYLMRQGIRWISGPGGTNIYDVFCLRDLLSNERILDAVFSTYMFRNRKAGPVLGFVVFGSPTLGDEAWVNYMQDPDKLEQLWNTLPDGSMKTEYEPAYNALHQNMDFYLQNCSAKNPVKRDTYLDQAQTALNCMSLNKSALDNNIDYTAGRNYSYGLSRKTGLLGGMYPIDLTRQYDPQPGVLDMHFERNNSYVYKPQAVDINGADDIGLKYDIVTIGTNVIWLMGKKTNETIADRLAYTTDILGYTRQQNDIKYSAQSALQNQYTDISFEVRSRASDGSSNYAQMFTSDYNGRYNATSAISGSSNYKTWFNNGVPTRIEGQDPLSDPLRYWPYTLQLSDLVWPAPVYAFVNSQTSVKLVWTDRSSIEDGFGIWWRTANSTYTEEPNYNVTATVDINGKDSCIVENLTSGETYYFAMAAKRGDMYSPYDNQASAKITVPATPCNIDAKFHAPNFSFPEVDTNPQIEINNNSYDFNANLYEWERKIGVSGVWEKIKETQSAYNVGYTDAMRISDSNITFNKDYYYRIRGYNGCGYSEYSEEVQVPVYFRTPTNFSATVENGDIILTWQDNSTIETGTVISYKKGDGEWVKIIVGPNIKNYTISDYFISPLNTYYVKVAQYWYYWDFKQTGSTEEIALFIPYNGYTDYNNARRLFRAGDGALHAAFYNDSLVYHAKSSDNGLDWTVENPTAYTTTLPHRLYSAKGPHPSIGEKRSNNSVYLVRAKQDSLLLDSLGSVTGLNMVIQAGGKRKLNPAIATDSLGSIYCVWAETVLTKETQTDWSTQYRITETIKILYSKRTSGTWSPPSVIDPTTIFSTGWLNYLPPPSSYSTIEIPQPTITVNKIGTTLTPHISWTHQRWGWNQYKYPNLTCDTSEIYYYTTGLISGTRISTPDSFAYSPCLGVNSSGSLSLAYQDGSDIYRRTNNGSTWSTPYNVSNNTGSSQMPTVAYDKGGAMHILWFDDSESGFVQKTSTLPAGTDAKLAIAKLTELPPGEESIIWEESTNVEIDTLNSTISKVSTTEALTTTVNATQIFYRRYKDNAWSPIYRLTASEEPSVYPSLPLTDDAAQMGFIWTEGNGVKYKRLPDLDAPNVAVTYPNGGDLLYSGRRYNITWASADNRGLKEYVLYYTTNYLTQDDPTAIDATTLWRSVATVPGNLNSYSWRVPYNVASTACRFKIVAYDSSGNTATDIGDKSFTIKSRDIAVVVTDKAIAYNNAGKIARSSDGLLHVCYNGIDSVYYMASSDDGQTWPTSLALDKGSLPTIATDSKNMPAMAWIKQWDNIAGGGVFFSRQTAAGWTVPETLAYMQGVLWDYIGGYSPPAMTIKNDTVSIVYEYSYGGGIPPHIAKGWALHHARFAVNNVAGKKDTTIDSYTEIINPPIWQTPASASIATDYKGYDHISWHRTDKVYYRIRKPDGNYGNIVQLSGTGIAQNPCISISGVASAVWVEEGDIYQRTGFDQKWAAASNVSASGANSMMPYICGSDVLWTEDVLSDYEVYLSSYSTAKMTYDVSENLSCTDYASIFPHETKLQTNEGTKTYRIWAEEIEPEVLWGLTFMADTTELEPTYALDAGQAEPSIFTVQRDGYITYGTSAKAKTTITEPFKTVDYDTTALIYSFDNFDPDKKYKITLSFYQETGQEIKLKPIVNKQPLGEIKVTSGEEAILDKPLPEASYKDGQIILTIEKVKGPIAVCGKILIYENPTGQGHGGAQSAEITSITPNYINKLYQNCPNPFSHKTNFMYQIKNQGQVTFKVYNALGQLVNTLVNETKPAGAYQVEWDGKDGCGLKVSSGVYIYRLQTGDFMETKKMVVIK